MARPRLPFPARVITAIGMLAVMLAGLAYGGYFVVRGQEPVESLRPIAVLAALYAVGIWIWWRSPPPPRREGDIAGQWRTPASEND